MSGNNPTGDSPDGGPGPYGPGQPGYGPGQPVYNPGQPSYNPEQPSYNPGQPSSNPGQPSYDPGQPAYNPGQPAYNPGQQGQPGYGAPQQPGGPGYGGPGGPGQQYGPPYGPPGGPPLSGGKTNPKLLLIIGAAVLALVIVGVGAAVLLNRSGKTATEPLVPSNPQSSAPPATTKPSDAVKAYLEALAAGRADTALALSDEQSADKTFLTDAVLADSNSRAPITEINVPEVSDEYTYSVDASYKIGDQAVAEKYSVKKAGTSWKVSNAFAEISLGTLRSKTLPMLINAVPVKTDKVRIFPGSYAVTSGNKYVDYGKDNVLLVESPSDYPRTSDVEAGLTEAGVTAFEAAVTSKVKTCLTKGVLAPTGCPNGIREASYQKIDRDTITWKLNGDPLANIKPRLDYENPVIAKASGTIGFDFYAKGTSFGDATTFARTVRSYGGITADMTETPIKAVFTN